MDAADRTLLRSVAKLAVFRVLGISLLIALASSALESAEHDWPQWRGPERTGRSRETGLLSTWPKDGPRQVWKITNAGVGYSGPAIANGMIFTMGNRGEDEFVLCFDDQTGKERWAIKNGKAYHNSYGDGPRCTPTVDGDRVYALGANGDLCCLHAKDSKEIWRINILKEFKGSNIGWGISESPLVEGNLLIVTPGGQAGTMAALDKMTGKTVWTSKDPNDPDNEAAGYASPIAFAVGGVRQVATFTSQGGIGVRVKDGKFLWRYDKTANGTANVATPVFHDDRIFFSSNYGTGCALLKLEPDGAAEEVYFNRDLKNHHGGVVLVGKHLYGFNGSTLTCMEFATGKVAWENRSVGKGSLCYADGHLYVLSENGVMGLVEASPAGYKEKARCELPDRSEQSSWTHPVIANGRLYLRDQENLFCYEVKRQ
jgi:outer membrane protein assembly factor BamB